MRTVGIALFLFSAACGHAPDSSDSGDSPSNSPSGTEPSFGGTAPLAPPGAAGDAGAPASSSGVLTAVVRDFRLWNPNDAVTVPDFENPPHEGDADDRGIVQPSLGTDGKPVYAKTTTLTTHGKANFDMWYRDTPGRNVRVEVPLPLTARADGSYAFGSEGFFPIDDGTPYATAFGNQGDPHNYSFTVEIHTVFTYRGSESFDFRGDDDVFVFIDGKLVIDLGGIHGPESASVAVADLGLVVGKEYPLDFFSAERHRTGSNILFSTTLDLRAAPIR